MAKNRRIRQQRQIPSGSRTSFLIPPSRRRPILARPPRRHFLPFRCKSESPPPPDSRLSAAVRFLPTKYRLPAVIPAKAGIHFHRQIPAFTPFFCGKTRWKRGVAEFRLPSFHSRERGNLSASQSGGNLHRKAMRTDSRVRGNGRFFFPPSDSCRQNPASPPSFPRKRESIFTDKSPRSRRFLRKKRAGILKLIAYNGFPLSRE